MLDGLHRDVTAKKKLEVDTQFLKHRVHQLGASSGQPQLLRDADLVIKHLLDTGAGPRAQSGEVLLELDELELAQIGGNLPRQEVPNMWCFFYYPFLEISKFRSALPSFPCVS